MIAIRIFTLAKLCYSMVAGLVLLAGAHSTAVAQCQLANPSFELPGTPGGAFDGWYELNDVSASATLVAHGQYAARMSGPDTGQWDVSAVWQPLDAAPGERWRVFGRAGHPASDPVVGAARGFINVEWRDANNDLIYYETLVAVEPNTPPGGMHRVAFETEPAPAGTVRAHITAGFAQSPAQESGTVYLDHIQARRLTSPTLDDIQWNDFPGGRAIDFAGVTWRVKGPGFYGPGSSLFADSADHVWVDAEGRLHMTIRKVDDTWYSTEVALVDALLYGDYIFTTAGRMDVWAPNVVLGMFLWQYPLCWDPANPWNLHCEFDVEISRWNDPQNDLGQFVTQPWDYPGNIERFDVDFFGSTQLTSYAFRWLPDRIEARAWYGGPYDEGPGTLIHAWTYPGPHIPLPEQPRIHINLWQLNGPPSNGLDHEAIFDDFRFVPSCVDDPAGNDWRCCGACLSGPDRALLNSCDPFDRDLDMDTDLVDVALYQRTFPG